MMSAAHELRYAPGVEASTSALLCCQGTGNGQSLGQPGGSESRVGCWSPSPATSCCAVGYGPVDGRSGLDGRQGKGHLRL